MNIMGMLGVTIAVAGLVSVPAWAIAEDAISAPASKTYHAPPPSGYYPYPPCH